MSVGVDCIVAGVLTGILCGLHHAICRRRARQREEHLIEFIAAQAQALNEMEEELLEHELRPPRNRYEMTRN